MGGTVPHQSSRPSRSDLEPDRRRPWARRAGVAALVAGTLAMVATGCAGSSDTGSSTGTTAPSGVQGNQVVKDEAKPETGGKIAYGLEAESDGFNPTVNRWAISGVMVGLAVYDPLAAYNDKSEAKPYLAEALTPNKDYTEWTIKLRPNITFSNGTPLTSVAVKQVLEAHLKSPLTKPVFSPVKSVEVKDELTVVVTMSTPWVVFPSTLTAQTGVIPEPGSLKDETGANPIGTGPFVQTEWVKDAKWVGKKNPTYWRKDKDGTQLPYLNELEFRPIIERNSRTSALRSGEIQMMHSTDSDSIKLLRDLASQGTVQLVEDNGEGEEGFIITNSTKAPFDDTEMRRALAYSTDTTAYADIVNMNVLEPADSVFRKNSQWYVEAKNYPHYDLPKAQELTAKYAAAHGGQKPKFDFGISGDTSKEAQFLQAGWQEAGFDVSIRNYEQASFISQTVVGDFQANLWRQFGAPDPDADYLWWTSANAGKGDGSMELTLNIARHKSECQDKAITAGRESADLATRKKAYGDLQQCFADEVPYVWLDHTVWVVAAAPNVRGITNGPLPDGEPSLPIGGAGDFGGVTRLTQTWLAK